MKAKLFTVVIAKKKHLESIRDYDLFLRPLLKDQQIVFCAWDTEAATPEKAVPELAEAVGRHARWRALVLMDEAGLERKNPFDLAPFSPPARAAAGSEDDYFAALRSAKAAAYDAAARLPLPRLMAGLCEEPLSAPGNNNMSAEPEYREYLWEAEYKRRLRREITGGTLPEFTLPTEICCVAMRCCSEKKYDIDTSWKSSFGTLYSRFFDWNLYFEKMRYLVFDVLPKKHQDYGFSYFRFLYSLLLVAGNETPQDALQPRRVYLMDCVTDERALRRLLVSYDEKLKATEEAIAEEIGKLEREQKVRISDEEAERLYCVNASVPVTIDQEMDTSPLYADKALVGMSSDCPGSEENRWEAAFARSERTLRKLVKQPRRSLSRAVENFHQLDCADLENVMQLNAFQTDDIREHIRESELGILSANTRDVTDIREFRGRMEEEDKAVRKYIETRMNRRTVLGIGLVSLLIYLLCFIPLLVKEGVGFGVWTVSLILTGAALGLLFLCGLVCLIVLRGRMREKLNHFNGVMGGIFNEIIDSLVQYTRYLSGACTMQRGASVLNYLNEHEDTGMLEVRLRKKHLFDIAVRRAELRDIFGSFLTDRSYADQKLIAAFPYDFSRPVCFPYPMPFLDGERRQIDFMQKGSQISIPVDFVRTLTVTMEELYE